MLNILLKAVAVYFLTLFVLKFMGKREIGQLSLFDFVVILIIADVAVISIENNDYPFYSYLLPIILIAVIQKTLAKVSLKITKLRDIFDGTESLIIVEGKINIKEMKKQSYNIDDLIIQLRLKNIRSISEVRYLVLETNGEISVFKWTDFETNQSASKDSNTGSSNLLTTKIQGSTTESNQSQDIFPFPLIISGKIKKTNLKLLNLTEEWLIHELKIKGYYNYKDIYYANYEYKSLFIAETCEF